MPGSPLLLLQDKTLDALVLGGGITGAASARALTVRGARVCLVEPLDFGWGGSGRTGRLALGADDAAGSAGGTFAETLLRERTVLARAARHLARIIPVLVAPGARGADRGGGRFLKRRASTRRLAAHGWPAPRTISRRQLEVLLPGVALALPDEPRIHFDALLDDRRLALVLALDARRSGAVLASRCELVGFEAAQQGQAWVEIRDRLTGETACLRTRALVNATGGWIDRTRRLFDVGAGDLFPVERGVRAVYAGPALEAALVLLQASGAQGPDSLHVVPGPAGPLVAAPAGSGTPASAGDLDAALRAAFPDAAGGRRVTFTCARVARDRPGVVREEKAGVPFWSVTSGTPLLARLAARHLAERLERDRTAWLGPVQAARGFLPGGDIATLAGEEAAARAAGLKPAQARWLVGRYGSLWRGVVESPGGTEPVGPGEVPVAGEVAWCFAEEDARTAADLFHRWRLPEIAPTRDAEAEIADETLTRVARLLDLPSARVERERLRWERERDLVYGGLVAVQADDSGENGANGPGPGRGV